MNQPERKISITVDRRERGKITKTLEQIPGVTLEFAELECGDYVLGGGYGVERKSATDFILSVVDKSLMDKVARLKARYAYPMFIVESGTRDLFTARFHQKAFDVHMALAYLSVMQHVPVLTTPDFEQSAMLIYFLAVDVQHHLGTTLDRRTNKPEVLTEAQQYFLEGLPGVDADRAEALLKRFGNVGAVLAASAAELKSAANLSDDSIAFMQQVLQMPWPR